jgi:UDP-N-acetylglucosamine--N-acetylmuramyl-(pentapeptide) pyrophosphoryl-undecaprenol N-acetylglucosamine transferase
VNEDCFTKGSLNPMRTKDSIVFAGGGSGGHISPIRATVPDIKQSGRFSNLYWIGTARFEQDAAHELGMTFVKIRTGKLRRYFDWKNVSDVFLTLFAVFRCIGILWQLKPRVVFASGGFVSVPVVIAAKVLHVEVVIHEQTMAVGLANKINSIFADKILLGFEDSKKHLSTRQVARAIVVGNPVDGTLLVKDDIRKYFPISADAKKIVYVTGGSQGAAIINESVRAILPQLLAVGWCVIHQCGKKDIVNAKKLERRYSGYYFAADFFRSELASIYQAANVVIARSGANTINELCYFEIPAVLIPLEPNNNGEQKLNAQYYVKNNIGIIIKQSELTPEVLWEAIVSLKPVQRPQRRTTKLDESKAKIVKLLAS